jgi:hypothetical protein
MSECWRARLRLTVTGWCSDDCWFDVMIWCVDLMCWCAGNLVNSFLSKKQLSRKQNNKFLAPQKIARSFSKGNFHLCAASFQIRQFTPSLLISGVSPCKLYSCPLGEESDVFGLKFYDWLVFLAIFQNFHCSERTTWWDPKLSFSACLRQVLMKFCNDQYCSVDRIWMRCGRTGQDRTGQGQDRTGHDNRTGHAGQKSWSQSSEFKDIRLILTLLQTSFSTNTSSEKSQNSQSSNKQETGKYSTISNETFWARKRRDFRILYEKTCNHHSSQKSSQVSKNINIRHWKRKYHKNLQKMCCIKKLWFRRSDHIVCKTIDIANKNCSTEIRADKVAPRHRWHDVVNQSSDDRGDFVK